MSIRPKRTPRSIPGTVLALCSLLVLVSSGCRSDVDHLVNPKPGVDIDTAQTNVPQFSDVPVPQGFSVRKGNLEAYTEEAGSYRAGRQRYEGSARPIDANAYYEERMPNHGWVLVERGTDDAGRLFTTWKKAHTTTRIEIDQDSRRAVTTIEVRVGTSLDPNFRP